MVGFIEEHRGSYGVEPICAVLPIAPRPIASSGPAEKRPARAKRDAALRPEIQRVWDENFAVYGAESIWR